MENTSTPPRRPQTESESDLGFARQPMVCWLSPRGLAATGLRVVLSSIFGAYSDKRELQAALQKSEPFDYTDGDELWFDYISDLGDGFNSTYHLARLLAGDELTVEAPDSGDGDGGGREPVTIPAGRILVMGGDQVYPSASKEDYEDRLIGPYRAALPWTAADRDLYAIPGNHDWYDGLTSFIRVFCQGGWIGGWQTRQQRSYFALELPHRWWLWGIDIQFDNYIDEPQLRYFDTVVGPQLAPGDSIILCSAKPSWVKCNVDHPEAFVNLDYFARKIVRERGAEVRLYLTGDTHHYARFAEEAAGDAPGGAAQQLITAGGGGAYLSNTHHLPDELELPPSRSRDPGKSAPSRRYRLMRAFPSRAVSNRLRRGIFDLPFQNRGFWGIAATLHLIFGWLVAGTLRGGGAAIAPRLRDLAAFDIVDTLLRSTLGVLALLALVVGLALFTQEESALKRWMLGAVHAALQFSLVVASIRIGSWLLTGAGDGFLFWVLFFLYLGVVGGLTGAFLTGLYLYVADAFSCNSNELFAAQRIQDYKCFLRLHLGRDGALTVYPIGVEKVCRKWALQPDGAGDEPWFAPAGPHTAARLIERPIRITPTA